MGAEMRDGLIEVDPELNFCQQETTGGASRQGLPSNRLTARSG